MTDASGGLPTLSVAEPFLCAVGGSTGFSDQPRHYPDAFDYAASAVTYRDLRIAREGVDVDQIAGVFD